MATPASIPFPADSDALAELARVCRDLFTLRARGRHDEASEVETKRLPATLDRVRAQQGDHAHAEDRIANVFAAEQERVANAEVLVELLAPALAERLGPVVSAASRAPAASAPRTSFLADPPPPASRPAPPTAPLQIADLLDDMLAQERRAPPSRRAS